MRPLSGPSPCGGGLDVEAGAEGAGEPGEAAWPRGWIRARQAGQKDMIADSARKADKRQAGLESRSLEPRPNPDLGLGVARLPAGRAVF